MHGTHAGGWEGDRSTAAAVMRSWPDDTMLVQWNGSKQFATHPTRNGQPSKAEVDAWYDLLDALVAAKTSLATIQEAGCGGSATDETRVRGIIKRWSDDRNIQAGAWLTGAKGTRDGIDVRAMGGAAAGLVTIALGRWAKRGRAARRWRNGRGLWVEFQEGQQLLCLGNVYGHANGTAADDAQWRLDVTSERSEAGARGCTTLVMGDFNCRLTSADAESGRAGDPTAAAWFTGEQFHDVWRERHPAAPGFTRQPDDQRHTLERTRIDYICADGDLPADAVHGVWLGPWGEGFALPSDHRPLAVALDTAQWLGTIGTPPPTTRAEDADSAFPPRSWFIASDKDKVTADADIARGRLPSKLPKDSFSDACSAPATLAALEHYKRTLEAQHSGSAKLATSAEPGLAKVWEAWITVGRAIRATLEPLLRRPAPARDGNRKPSCHIDALRIKGLSRWLRKLRQCGANLFIRGAPQTHSRFDAIPDELWTLWDAAVALEAGQAEPDNSAEIATEQWRRAVDLARLRDSDDSDQLNAQSRLPRRAAELTRSEWLIALLRIRIGAAKADVRDKERSARTHAQWQKRLAVATAALEGRTGGVYEAINPRTRPIRVDGANVMGSDGVTRWQTDADTLRDSAAKHCATTVQLSVDKERRGTHLSPAARQAGALDSHFNEPRMASARAVLNERKPEIAAADLVQAWTGERLMAAVASCDDSAPGPSGLCYWMIAGMTEDMRTWLARMMNELQAQGKFPNSMRHGHVYPIPKLGSGGSTFAGARQIVLLEVTMKLISGGIAENAMRIWEERGYLHWAQHGFRKLHNAGDVAAAVAGIQDLYRRRGKPLFTVAADVTKAFQSVGLPAIETALRRLGLPESVIELWMQTDRGDWLEPTTPDGLWGASYATCQVITSAGLSPSFPTETGVRQGERASATKYLAWMEMLWAYLEAEEVRGAAIDLDNPDGQRIAFLGFADDIWCASDSFEELQRMVHLIDLFMGLFHVELNPGKSMYAAINADTNAHIGLYRPVDGIETFVPLQRVANNAGYRYLGIMLQPDGGWGAMTAVVIGKVRAWATQVARARLPIDQATMVLKSVVGGLLNYVLRAAPLAATTMTSIDKMVAAALYKCAGLARGRRTAWAFMPVTDGGFGAASAVIMRRSIVLETVLTWLNGQEPPTS